MSSGRGDHVAASWQRHLCALQVGRARWQERSASDQIDAASCSVQEGEHCSETIERGQTGRARCGDMAQARQAQAQQSTERSEALERWAKYCASSLIRIIWRIKLVLCCRARRARVRAAKLWGGGPSTGLSTALRPHVGHHPWATQTPRSSEGQARVPEDCVSLSVGTQGCQERCTLGAGGCRLASSHV
jgi:hypothetical protein